MFIHPVFAILTPTLIIVSAFIILLLFGAERLPKLARSAAEARKILKGQAEADQAARVNATGDSTAAPAADEITSPASGSRPSS